MFFFFCFSPNHFFIIRQEQNWRLIIYEGMRGKIFLFLFYWLSRQGGALDGKTLHGSSALGTHAIVAYSVYIKRRLPMSRVCFFLRSIYWYFLLIYHHAGIVWLVATGSGVRLTGVKIPSLALYGTDVEMDCPFTVLNRKTQLYSVKWYQNSEEFYSYIFQERSPVMTHPRPGIHVDVSILFPSVSATSCPMLAHKAID